MLKWNIQVRQNLAVGHQWDHLIDMRIGIDVVQPHPHAELAERAGEIEQLIAIAEIKLRRVRNLAEANVAPKNQVVDAETELEGLRRRAPAASPPRSSRPCARR